MTFDHAPRACVTCGAVFTPTNSRNRNCRACSAGNPLPAFHTCGTCGMLFERHDGSNRKCPTCWDAIETPWIERKLIAHALMAKHTRTLGGDDIWRHSSAAMVADMGPE